MSRPICASCAVELQCQKNGVWVNDPKVAGWPATYWSADRYVCPGCGAAVIVGRGGSMTFPDGKEPENSLEFRVNLDMPTSQALES